MAKILVSLKDALVARIDREARRLGLTRSAYLARLAERDLGAGSGPGRQASVGRAIDAIRELVETHGWVEDSTKAIRAERDAR